MGTCQNDWLVTGPLAHTRYIPRYIGYVTEGGFRDIPKVFCQGVCNRLAFQGVCNRGLVARNATTPLFGTPPYENSCVTSPLYTIALRFPRFRLRRLMKDLYSQLLGFLKRFEGIYYKEFRIFWVAIGRTIVCLCAR